MVGKIEPVDYVYKTKPYDHQHECFMLSRDEVAFALLMEMGTGKSKVIIDTAAFQYNAGKVNALVVIAPNGVHRNWITDEIPAHLPDYIEYTAGYWVASPKVAERKALERMFTDDPHKMRVIAINIDAMVTKRGKVFLRKILNAFNALMCVDESSDIKTAGAGRTMSTIALGKYAVMRRICSGTAITQGPLDLYSQYKYLSPTILGYTTKAAFRSRFAEYEQIELRAGSMNPGRAPKAGRDFYEKFTGYKNLGELTDLIRPFSYRKLKKDCLDIPEKYYAPPRIVTLSKEQRRLYADAFSKTVVFLRQQQSVDMPLFDDIQSDDDLIDAIMQLDTKTKITNALTKLLRLQQIIGGYFTDEDGTVHAIDKKNKRVEALMHLVHETQTPVIIWARFRPEIAAIVEALSEEYGAYQVVEYHGGVSNDDKEEAKARFQGTRAHFDVKTSVVTRTAVPDEERARFFVGNPAAGGRGLTLTAAEYMFYYSNSYSLEQRLQSEDRAHRIGQMKNVTYVDLEAEKTIDGVIKKVLLDKKQISDTVLDGL